MNLTINTEVTTVGWKEGLAETTAEACAVANSASEKGYPVSFAKTKAGSWVVVTYIPAPKILYLQQEELPT